MICVRYLSINLGLISGMSCLISLGPAAPRFMAFTTFLSAGFNWVSLKSGFRSRICAMVSTLETLGAEGVWSKNQAYIAVCLLLACFLTP